MFFYTGRITDFRRPTHQSSLNRGLFALCPTSLEHWIPMCWTGVLVDA